MHTYIYTQIHIEQSIYKHTYTPASFKGTIPIMLTQSCTQSVASYVCVCIYIYTHTYIHTYIYIPSVASIHTYIYIYTYIKNYIRGHIHTSIIPIRRTQHAIIVVSTKRGFIPFGCNSQIIVASGVPSRSHALGQGNDCCIFDVVFEGINAVDLVGEISVLV